MGATRSTRWAIGLTVALWAIAGAGVALIALLLDSPSVSVSGSVLGMGSAVSIFIPVLAILMAASDWQSRDIQTTFVFEPRRQLVFLAKCTAVLIVCATLLVTAAVLALILTVVLALSTASTIAWDADSETAWTLIGSGAVGALSGIAYGAASQRSVLAITFALVQGLAIDPLLLLVPRGDGSWFRLSAIVEAVGGSGAIGPAIVSGLLWLAVPFAIGFVRHLRADVQ